MNLSPVIAILLTLHLTSCSNDKDLKSSLEKDIKTEFLSTSNQINNKNPVDKWWLEFNDILLNELIEVGLENNKDIQLANVAITTARQLNNINITELFPSGKIGIERQKFASPVFGPNGIRYDFYQAVFDASWELDFLGKNLDHYKAGKLRFLKEIQLYKANSIRVASEIAQNYITLKSTQKQIANLSEILTIHQKLNKIVKQKEQNGIYSKTDVHKAEINYHNAYSDLTAAKTSEKILTYRLAVLLGLTPEKTIELLKKSNNSKKIFDYYSGVVPIGLKSDILKRRPDILAAEYEIDASLHDKSAQFKEFFPSFNLTARAGGGAKDLGDVLKSGMNVKDIRGGVSLPIFSMGELMAQYKITKAKAKSAVLNYEKTVLDAVADCESSLTRYIDALVIEKNTSNVRSASANILKIEKNKKSFGAISDEQFLNSKIFDLNSEIALAQKKSETLGYLIALHKALGGGFEGYEMKFEKDHISWVKEKTTEFTQ